MTHSNSSNCHQTLERLNAYIDGELDASLCSLLEEHMEGCADCRIVFNTLQKTIELCKSDGEKISLPQDARQRLFAALKLEDDIKTGD